ncbi:MAG: hypothetical protein DHS20C01_10930 [marine bacterium B5-7]|nr:MAG: hypothetical protein DHS20C01_10930 [marine bacterium B5-7]
MAGLLILLIVMSFDYGITVDEYSRQRNGEYIFEFFRSGFTTLTVDEDKGRFYSGFFDLVAVSAQKILPFEIFDTRHIVNALFGWIGVLYTGLLARRIAGNTAAFVAVALLILSPRYLGHMMNNPKDIPFASMHVMALYYLSLATLSWPIIRLPYFAMLILAIALAISVRVGGVVLLCYSITYLGTLFLANRIPERDVWRRLVLGAGVFTLIGGMIAGAATLVPASLAVIVTLCGYLASRFAYALIRSPILIERVRCLRNSFAGTNMSEPENPALAETGFIVKLLVLPFAVFAIVLLFWPWAMMDPLTRIPQAITTFSSYPHHSFELYNGSLILSNTVCCENWHYIPNWIARTIPLIVIGGLFSLFACRLNRNTLIAIGLLLFVIIAPWLYGFISHANYYDGWRHFFFVYPPIVVLATIGWTGLLKRLGKFRHGRMIFLAISLLVVLSDSVRFTVANHPHQSVYFNPLFGGMQNALGNYELDYWENCSREAMQVISNLADEGETLRVAGGYKMVEDYAKNLGNIEIVRSRKNNDPPIDYSIIGFKHIVPKDIRLLANLDNPVHRVEVDGVPICMVVRGDSGIRCRFNLKTKSRICRVVPELMKK